MYAIRILRALSNQLRKGWGKDHHHYGACTRRTAGGSQEALQLLTKKGGGGTAVGVSFSVEGVAGSADARDVAFTISRCGAVHNANIGGWCELLEKC